MLDGCTPPFHFFLNIYLIILPHTLVSGSLGSLLGKPRSWILDLGFHSRPVLTMPHFPVNTSHPFSLAHSGDTSVSTNPNKPPSPLGNSPNVPNDHSDTNDPLPPNDHSDTNDPPPPQNQRSREISDSSDDCLIIVQWRCHTRMSHNKLTTILHPIMSRTPIMTNRDIMPKLSVTLKRIAQPIS